MRAIGRWLLLFVLVLGVPVKSLAAAGGAACAQLQGGGSSHNHGGHDHAPATDPGDEDADTVRCSSCAPCCVAIAPAPEPVALGAPARPSIAAPATTGQAVGGVADVPDRPPR